MDRTADTSPARPLTQHTRTVRFWRRLNEMYCRSWFGLKRDGPCTIPAGGPVILASNHTATIDPLLLIAACPHRFPSFLMAAEYYELLAARRLFRMIECIPVERRSLDARAVRAAVAHLRAGKVLGIFPEGGVPRPGEVRRPMPGVAMLALRSGATVIPAYISGTRYSPRVALPFFCRHRARVCFGEPVNLSEFRALPARAAYQAAADCIMQAIRELAGLPNSAPFRSGAPICQETT